MHTICASLYIIYTELLRKVLCIFYDYNSDEFCVNVLDVCSAVSVREQQT